MASEFENPTDVIEYLKALEKRLDVVEQENRQFRLSTASPQGIEPRLAGQNAARVLPITNLLSPSFFKRAFAVWGHFFVANLIIGITLGIIYFCFAVVLFGTILGPLINNSSK